MHRARKPTRLRDRRRLRRRERQRRNRNRQTSALKRALRALADDQADRLIVAKLDRLARNVRVALEIDKEYATRHGWGIVFGDMDIDTSTAVGKMQLSMFASVARFERDRISERTREALAVKRAQGVRLGRPSNLPPETVARIVAERDAGSSLRAIADGLTRDEIRTAQGGRAWYASTVRKVLASQQGEACRPQGSYAHLFEAGAKSRFTGAKMVY